MTEFTLWNAGTHPLVLHEDDYNNILDHAFIKEANYIIYTDGTNVKAISGSDGKVFDSDAGTDLAPVLQNCITTLAAAGDEGGLIRVKKSTAPELYLVGAGRYSVRWDYTWSTQVTCPEGISVVGDGVIIKAITYDGYHFKYYTLGAGGSGYEQHQKIQKMTGFMFVGLRTNMNAGAIWNFEMQQLTILQQIYTTEMNQAIKLEGPCYRTKVTDCMLEGYPVGTGTAVQIIIGTGGAYPNASKVTDNDISGWDIGVAVDGGYGYPITNNYFEGNTIAIDNDGGVPQITSNIFLVKDNDTGISTATRSTIVGNYFEIEDSSIGIQTAAETYTTVTGNEFYGAGTLSICIDATAQIFHGTVSGNIINCASTGWGLYGLFTVCTISGNFIWGHDCMIYQSGSHSTINGNYFYNGPLGLQLVGNDNDVTGNYFYLCTVDIDSNGAGNWIHNNRLHDGTITLTGGTPIIRGNLGYVTENGGTSAILNTTTSIAVAHGCAYTPSIQGYSKVTLQFKIPP